MLCASFLEKNRQSLPTRFLHDATVFGLIGNSIANFTNKARGGIRGHFCMFRSYESILYCLTTAFYGTKLSRRVKKLLSFQGWRSDNFPTEICRRNLVILVHIFLFFDLRCSNTNDPQSSITFWHDAIASFRKKRLLSDKKYFHIKQTCKNDPGPPSHLNR